VLEAGLRCLCLKSETTGRVHANLAVEEGEVCEHRRVRLFLIAWRSACPQRYAPLYIGCKQFMVVPVACSQCSPVPVACSQSSRRVLLLVRAKTAANIPPSSFQDECRL